MKPEEERAREEEAEFSRRQEQEAKEEQELSRREKLINRIWAMTSSGQLRWGITEEEEEFQVSFPRQSIRITKRTKIVPDIRSPDLQSEVSIYSVQIYNNRGALIEEIDSRIFPDHMERTLEAKLVETYYGARRQAYKVEDNIDDLLSQLM